MLSHYWKVALRGFLKNKITSLVSLLGLSLGLACALLGFLYINYQTGFDQFQQKKDRLYRVIFREVATSGSWVKIAAPYLPKSKETVPEIENFVRIERISHEDKVVVEVGERKFIEDYFMMADPEFFSVFSYPLIEGDANQVLKDPGGVVITERVARKLFGDEDPVGKLIKVNQDQEFIVSGVAKNPPDQSHLTFDYLVSFENLANFFGEDAPNWWGANNYFGYVLLHNEANTDQALDKMQQIAFRTEKYSYTFENIDLQPVTRIHFEQHRGNLLPGTDPRYLWIFGSISLFVLIIALANYINITIASSITRSKEYGVRKALGAARATLIRQLILETFVSMMLGVFIAVLWVYAALPLLNSLLESKIALSFDGNFFLITGLIVLLTTLMASSYLSFTITKNNSLEILKGKVRSGKGFGLQKSLLAIQFVISIILIINTFIINNQLDFLQSKDIGLNPEGVVSVPLFTRLSPGQLETLKTEIRKIGTVINTSASTFTPGDATWHQTVVWDGQTPDQEDNSFMYITVIDRDFVRTLGLELVYGNLDDIENMPGDQVKYLINESGLKFIGWDNPEGKLISPFGPSMKANIVGVVKDFNFKSLHDEMGPLLMPMSDQFFHRQFSIRVSTGDLPHTISEIETTFKKFTDGQPFEFHFLSDSIENLYTTEKEAGQLVSISTLFALILATIGLFGIVSFSLEEKTKEIAIRKILGISASEMLTLFSKGYMYILGLSCIIALPVSWYLMNAWLSNFAYRMDLTVLPFIAAVLLTGLVILGVIGFKILSIRRLNPINALKYE